MIGQVARGGIGVPWEAWRIGEATAHIEMLSAKSKKTYEARGIEIARLEACWYAAWQW